MKCVPVKYTNCVLNIHWLNANLLCYCLTKKYVVLGITDEILRTIRSIIEAKSHLHIMCTIEMQPVKILMHRLEMIGNDCRRHSYATNVSVRAIRISQIVISINVCQCVVIFLTPRTCDYLFLLLNAPYSLSCLNDAIPFR